MEGGLDLGDRLAAAREDRPPVEDPGEDAVVGEARALEGVGVDRLVAEERGVEERQGRRVDDRRAEPAVEVAEFAERRLGRLAEDPVGAAAERVAEVEEAALDRPDAGRAGAAGEGERAVGDAIEPSTPRRSWERRALGMAATLAALRRRRYGRGSSARA